MVISQLFRFQHTQWDSCARTLEVTSLEHDLLQNAETELSDLKNGSVWILCLRGCVSKLPAVSYAQCKLLHLREGLLHHALYMFL